MATKLTNPQVFKLYGLMEREYAASGKIDEDFAVYATDMLGFNVNKNHVEGARRQLGIDQNGRIRQSTTVPRAAERIALLEEQVESLNKRLEYQEAWAKANAPRLHGRSKPRAKRVAA